MRSCEETTIWAHVTEEIIIIVKITVTDFDEEFSLVAFLVSDTNGILFISLIIQ